MQSFRWREIHPFRKVHTAGTMHLHLLFNGEQTPTKTRVAKQLSGERHKILLLLLGHHLVGGLLVLELLCSLWEYTRTRECRRAEESVDYFVAAGCEAVCAEGGVG